MSSTYYAEHELWVQRYMWRHIRDAIATSTVLEIGDRKFLGVNYYKKAVCEHFGVEWFNDCLFCDRVGEHGSCHGCAIDCDNYRYVCLAYTNSTHDDKALEFCDMVLDTVDEQWREIKEYKSTHQYVDEETRVFVVNADNIKPMYRKPVVLHSTSHNMIDKRMQEMCDGEPQNMTIWECDNGIDAESWRFHLTGIVKGGN